jgi:hypothetical protein
MEEIGVLYWPWILIFQENFIHQATPRSTGNM